LSSWIYRSADGWGVSRARAWRAVLAPPLGLLIIVGIRFLHAPTFRLLMEEDGLVEWMQFACFLGAGVVAALIAVHRFSAGHRWQAGLFALACIGLIFVTGEEIAWGQRILAMSTPSWLEEINLQEEITVHNIAGVLVAFNAVLLITSLYAMVAEPLSWRFRFASRWELGSVLFVPPFFLVAAFGVMAAFRLQRFVSGTPSQYTITKLIEWAELCYAAAALWFLWLAYQRAHAATMADDRRRATNR
jgi:hypothetical protein